MELGALNSIFLNVIRTQFLTYLTVESLVSQQNIGTIQGSKFASRLFDIYSNDMNAIFKNNENVLYADDTAIACVGDDLIAPGEKCQQHTCEIVRLVPIQQNVFEPF